MTTEERRVYNKAWYLRNRDKQRAYSHSYYRRNLVKCRRYSNERNRERIAEKRAFVDSLKGTTPCKDCGQIFPSCCMDYDHLPGCTKVETISQMVGNQKYGIPDIQKEMSKCELVCANCHRIRTHLERKLKGNMPENYAPYSSDGDETRGGGNPVPPTSPFNYDIDEEVERQKALDRANDKVKNNPSRPIL